MNRKFYAHRQPLNKNHQSKKDLKSNYVLSRAFGTGEFTPHSVAGQPIQAKQEETNTAKLSSYLQNISVFAPGSEIPPPIQTASLTNYQPHYSPDQNTVSEAIIQRDLTTYTPSNDQIQDDVKRQEIITHCNENFKNEARLIGNLIKFYEQKFQTNSTDGTDFLTQLNSLYKDLTKNATTFDLVKNIEIIDNLVSVAKVWGGETGLISLYKERFNKMYNYTNQCLQTSNMLSDKREAYQLWRTQFIQFTNVKSDNIVAKITNFSNFLKQQEQELNPQFSFNDAVREVNQAEEQQENSQVWKNEFFFPKVRTKLGLTSGTGQQLYTSDVNYDTNYKWHISVAFKIVNSTKQLVRINKIHLSFKHKTGGGDKSVWFTPNNQNLNIDQQHGNYPDQQQINFAKNKVSEWAQNYPKFNVQF